MLIRSCGLNQPLVFDNRIERYFNHTTLTSRITQDLILCLAPQKRLELLTYDLEDRCSIPTELLGHMLDGCFAVSKHYHRLLGGFYYKRSAPPYTWSLILTGLVLHTSLELVAYGFEVRHSIQLS